MFSKPIIYLGVAYACLALPAWAAIASEHREVPLSISTDAAQEVDPALKAFVQQVWSESPAMQGAQAAVEAARARADGADKPLHNPALELDAEQTDINTTTFGLSQTIDWSDKRGALTRIAGRELQVAQASLREIRQGIAAETLNALTHYSTARWTQVLALRRSQLMKEFIDAVKQRRAAGDVAALDVTLAQVAYSEALMEQAASESELVESEAALQAVSGLAMARWPQLPNELAPPPVQADPALLKSLPRLAVLRSRMEAARARINLAKKQRKIDPVLGIRAGRDGSDELLGLSIGIPLFVRNNYRAGVRVASHEAAVEEQAYRNAYRRANARLAGALGRFDNTSRAWSIWVTTGQQALGEQMSLLEQMWQAGELTATDFLIQAKQNTDTQAAATALMGEVWQAAIAWLDASGQVGSWLGLTNGEIEMNSGELK